MERFGKRRTIYEKKTGIFVQTDELKHSQLGRVLHMPYQGPFCFAFRFPPCSPSSPPSVPPLPSLLSPRAFPLLLPALLPSSPPLLCFHPLLFAVAINALKWRRKRRRRRKWWGCMERGGAREAVEEGGRREKVGGGGGKVERRMPPPGEGRGEKPKAPLISNGGEEGRGAIYSQVPALHRDYAAIERK